MKLLKEEGYHSVTLEDVYAWKQGEKELTEKSIAITFDDGFYSTTKFALPVLKRYGFTGSVFVIGSAIDEQLRWDRKAGLYHLLCISVW